jgi:hypothetical protein
LAWIPQANLTTSQTNFTFIRPLIDVECLAPPLPRPHIE